MSLIFIDKIPANLRTEFEKKLRVVCMNLKIRNPNWLMALIWAESRFIPTAKAPDSTATGLIQFLESTANEIGYSTAQIAKMNVIEQLVPVERYLSLQIKRYGLPDNGYELYELVHYPAAFKKANGFILYSKGSAAYNANRLDYDKDGNVTVFELKTFLEKQVNPYYDISFLNQSESGQNVNQFIQGVPNFLLWVIVVGFFFFTGFSLLKPGSWKAFRIMIIGLFKK
ncbi:Transglycosylase SLT domain-containing protein [Pseudarcicella hirudinis]|uniref:Transglycosylase SLT domain-containing protein n=1 Tax=Pseudarcicella hirudinis TaxID=1079859 RepID=A0A1I5MZ41_9BACT|nr:lytic transglycosylase domain-containing protein [Pseudarcicella hirudinis]SFP14808.1 Transglycosylase SLT domain-containing protein [Pseudarcicella hirudinis]